MRTMGVDNALALLRGGPGAATGYLHERMGNGLVPAMVPALADAIRIGNDPVIAQALQALTGVDPGAVAGIDGQLACRRRVRSGGEGRHHHRFRQFDPARGAVDPDRVKEG